MNSGSPSAESSTDLEFIRELREIVDRYLRAVDGWESAYKRFSGGSSHRRSVTPDLQGAQSEYVRARSELNRSVPRARRLCGKFEARDPFPGLMRVQLGVNSPAVGEFSVLGRNERAALAECLAHLEAMCVEAEHAEVEHLEKTYNPDRRSIFRRIYDFFF